MSAKISLMSLVILLTDQHLPRGRMPEITSLMLRGFSLKYLPISIIHSAISKGESLLAFFCFLFIWVFFHNLSRIIGLQGKGESIPLTPHYHFYPLHRHLDISRVITAES